MARLERIAMIISGIMLTVTLMTAAVIPMVNGCGLVCECFAIRGFTSRLFQISENTFYYNLGVMYAANCSDRYLSSVPYGLHDDVSTLFLDHNNLTYLSNNIFANRGLQKLDALYLNNNSISLIEEKAFLGLNGLQTLVLDGNKITTLPLNVFEPCEHLKYLSMRGNNLILSDSIFQDKTRFLQTVMISHCNLRTLPKDFTSMQLSDLDISNNDLGGNIVLNFPVQSLKVSKNNIIDLTKEGTKLSSLKILDLRGNTLIYKPDTTFKAPKLEILMLSSCNLTNDFDHLLKDATELKILELSNNNINEMKSSVISMLVNLEELHLQDNNIKILSPNILANNKMLNKVNLTGNPLDFPWDGTFLNSSSLKFLYMSYCNITTLTSESLENIPSVQILDMRYNYIEGIGECFHHLLHLERLFLDGNRIRTVNSEAFINNINLIELTLSGNPIVIPSMEPFLHAPSLNVLALNFCNITYIPSNTFKNTPYLTSLSLSNNSLKTVNLSVFQKINKLEKLDLRGNPLICNSRMKQLLSWCLKHGIEGHAICAVPKGDWKMLEHLHLDDNAVSLPESVSIIGKDLEVQERKQNIIYAPQRPSSTMMYLLLVVGLTAGTVVGVALEIVISRRYRCFSLGRGSFHQETLIRNYQ